MRNHLVVKLSDGADAAPPVRDWVTFIADKTASAESLHPGVDRALHAEGRDFWTTAEYAPAGSDWDQSERAYGLDRTYRLILDDLRPLRQETLIRLRELPSVESVHELAVASSTLPVPRPAGNRGDASAHVRERIGVGFAHALTRGHSDVRVAVLDTGIHSTHPELQGKVVDGADFVDLQGLDTSAFVGDFLEADRYPEDELGHGTHVAGIVAAEGLSMDAGVAPGCSLLAVRVLATMRHDDREQGAGLVDNINTAIKWAVDAGASVINMSLGIQHTGGGLPHEDVVHYALARGVTVVAASGNDGTDTKYYPGALPGVLAVGAVAPDGGVAPFTSYGAPITVVAPGVDVLSAYAHGRYAVASGTSQAAPFLAGTVALLQSCARDRGARLAPSTLMDLLRETSDRSDTRLRSELTGYGTVNLTDAFKWLLASLN